MEAAAVTALARCRLEVYFEYQKQNSDTNDEPSKSSKSKHHISDSECSQWKGE